MEVSRINAPIIPDICNVSNIKLQKFEHEENNSNLSFGLTLNDEGRTFKFIKWLGDDFNSAMQRLVSGVTALVTQPFFDWNNKNVDEDTRRASTARTLGKIIAGMLTGVTIRQICISTSKKFTQNNNTEQYLIDKGKKTEANRIKEFRPMHQCLLPESFKEADYRKIKGYRGAIGTFAAVGIMIFTNFIIDVPLTTKLTNYFVKKFKESDEFKKKSMQGGNQ